MVVRIILIKLSKSSIYCLIYYYHCVRIFKRKGGFMSCSYYGFRNNDYYCYKKGDYVNTDTYRRYCRDYSYDECPIYKHEESSGCYLTTIVCNVLRENDRGYVLSTLRDFRDRVLQNDNEYDSLLEQYDTVGPKISRCINQDDNRLDVSVAVFYKSLLPICGCIKANKNEEAVLKYKAMTLGLIEHYGLKEKYDDVVSLGDKNRGHGRCRKKENN